MVSYMAKFASYESMTSEKGWFSIIPALSYGKFLNMIVGPRSTGKSVGTAIYMLWRYFKYGDKFMYVRRTKDTLELTAVDWFTSAVEILKDNGFDFEFSYDKKNYYINGEHCGYALPLNAQQKVKGKNYSDCKWIIYDEFIAFDGERYLGSSANPLSEYKSLISLFQTVDRGVGRAFRNETKIIALGNAETFYNPLFMGTKADAYLRLDAHFIAPKTKQWMVQLVHRTDSKASEDYKNSIGYQLSDERTKAYAYENISKENMGSEFIKKILKPMQPLCNFIWEGHKMGLYADHKAGIFYVSTKSNYSPENLALTTADHRPNYFLAQHYNPYITLLRDAYDSGNLFFENAHVKFYIDNYLNYTI